MLQELYKDEWEYFCARCHVQPAWPPPPPATAQKLGKSWTQELASSVDRALERARLGSSTDAQFDNMIGVMNELLGGPHAEQIRWWASVRAQTLARTVRGVMQYEKALVLQAMQEDASLEPEAATQLVRQKFELVVACQKYGDWKASKDPTERAQAADVDMIMHTFPGLRVVYPEKVAARTWVSERQDETTARETDLEQGPEQGRVSVAAPDHLADVAEGIGEAVGNISELGRSGSGLSAPKPPPVAPPPPVTNATTWGAGAENGVDAVLIGLSADCAKIEELGRVAMPGNPILGEGKPENQNIALTFTRGQRVMLIDMNQDAYFEEALKVRNLLQEFEPAHSTSPPVSSSDHRPITIVGFPENVFSSTSGFATAIYAAMQERYFGTFYQRVLASPLDVRMHYGHPDLVDKLHFMTRGGVAKASKEINLSEDVFAGYKTTLRGGRSVFKEYHQLGKGRGVNLAEVIAIGAGWLQGADCLTLPLIAAPDGRCTASSRSSRWALPTSCRAATSTACASYCRSRGACLSSSPPLASTSPTP